MIRKSVISNQVSADQVSANSVSWLLTSDS
jgi:hypothetical protein